MHENLKPLSWKEIVAKCAPEELPFLRYFEETAPPTSEPIERS